MKSPCPVLGALAVWLIVASGVALAADAETVGQVVTMPERPGPHWFWLSDILLHRTALFDADTGGLLGQISSGTAGVGFVIAPLFSPDHREIYLAETYYARGVRGKRTDVVTVYDAATLQPLGDEIEIPAERAEYFPGTAANALSDDGRFMAVFNLTPPDLRLDRGRERAALHRARRHPRVQPRVHRRRAPFPHAVRERRRAQ